ncbi:phBC6A51 family helix-turn-helix protein [Paenibacillus sp. MER 99-2]|uniref:phBC6A51 family helix-turn-helix protein n=1 Tax=Paenibacillus sp. MER 99-2 TaxID=2939572 RepID=UPI00203B64C8|nr:phBC6A51 family helix-turn-helix protein [Paenibacillus sp. MER 99-2]MCM3175941.1 phBC6A51 family helix-turn-helix protein [Paenibacillus sp. MER 99-2]
MGANKKRKRRRADLDDRHYLAIELLTTVPTPNLDDIARTCGVDRRTLYRWRLRKDFDKAWRELSRHKAAFRFRRVKRKAYEISRVEDIELILRANKLVG